MIPHAHIRPCTVQCNVLRVQSAVHWVLMTSQLECQVTTSSSSLVFDKVYISTVSDLLLRNRRKTPTVITGSEYAPLYITTLQLHWAVKGKSHWFYVTQNKFWPGQSALWDGSKWNNFEPFWGWKKTLRGKPPGIGCEGWKTSPHVAWSWTRAVAVRGEGVTTCYHGVT